MRLTAGLALTLLAYQQICSQVLARGAAEDKVAASAAASAAATRREARKRMLQKKEIGGRFSKPKETDEVVKKANNDKAGRQLQNSGVDANDNGVEPQKREYYYGEAIDISFCIMNHLLTDDELAKVNVTRMDEWGVGMYMRMADPQNGQLQPILRAVPTFNDRSMRMLRRLQDETPANPPPPQDEAEFEDEGTEFDDGQQLELDICGTATFLATDTETIDPREWGTGFHFYVIDETGAALIGPGTVYMLETEEMEDAARAAQEVKDLRRSRSGIGRHPRGTIKTTHEPQVRMIDIDDLGMGTGRGNATIIAVVPPLDMNSLVTDKSIYDFGETVKVHFEVHTGTNDSDRRVLKGNDKKKRGLEGADVDVELLNSDYTDTDATATSATATAGATTTTTEATVDQSGTAGMDEYLEDHQEPEAIDPDNITLWEVAVFMRMERPQIGRDPIISIPFCDHLASEDCDSIDVEDNIASGDVTIDTGEFDLLQTGTGYDIWIVNGLGEGRAGPVHFYINIED